MGNQAIAFDHMEKVNNWDHKKVVNHVAMEYMIFHERSKHQWTIDLSILYENFDVDEKLIVEAQKKPRDTSHPWKKKKRRRRKKKR
jgi:uncharacterized protein YbcC (UPF0753/DUF2309 family)